MSCHSNDDLRSHLHETLSLEDIKPLWDSDQYLHPFLQDDSLLYRLGGEDEDDETAEKDELMTHLKNFENTCIDSEFHEQYGKQDVASGGPDLTLREPERYSNDKSLRAYFPNRLAKDVKIVNEDYFGSYSSFGIHREMLGDKA